MRVAQFGYHAGVERHEVDRGVECHGRIVAKHLVPRAVRQIAVRGVAVDGVPEFSHTEQSVCDVFVRNIRIFRLDV